MENKERTLIGIGTLTIACLCYFYNQYKQERLEYKAKKKELEDKCREIAQHSNIIDLEAIKTSGKKELVFFPLVTEYKLNEGTFKRFIRYRKNQYIVPRVMDSLRENETGGRFEFSAGDNK
jgi:hypothetical protein